MLRLLMPVALAVLAAKALVCGGGDLFPTGRWPRALPALKLPDADIQDMVVYQPSGFSVGAGVCVEAHDRACAGATALLRLPTLCHESIAQRGCCIGQAETCQPENPFSVCCCQQRLRLRVGLRALRSPSAHCCRYSCQVPFAPVVPE